VKEWQVKMKEVRNGRMLEAKAKMMRAAKKARWQETHEESSHDREKHGGEGSAHDDLVGPSTSRVGHAPEPNDDGLHLERE